MNPHRQYPLPDRQTVQRPPLSSDCRVSHADGGRRSGGKVDPRSAVIFLVLACLPTVGVDFAFVLEGGLLEPITAHVAGGNYRIGRLAARLAALAKDIEAVESLELAPLDAVFIPDPSCGKLASFDERNHGFLDLVARASDWPLFVTDVGHHTSLGTVRARVALDLTRLVAADELVLIAPLGKALGDPFELCPVDMGIISRMYFRDSGRSSRVPRDELEDVVERSLSCRGGSAGS